MSEARVSPEWSTSEWKNEWNIHVGTVFYCEKCGYIAIVTKSGVGNLEPLCCGEVMKMVENPDALLNGSEGFEEIENEDE